MIRQEFEKQPGKIVDTFETQEIHVNSFDEIHVFLELEEMY